MVIEAHSGAWSATAREFFTRVAAGQAAQSSTSSDACSLMSAQRLSIALHRENARAVMKRMVAPAGETGHSRQSGWAFHDDNLED
jgi:hypothetical protein